MYFWKAGDARILDKCIPTSQPLSCQFLNFQNFCLSFEFLSKVGSYISTFSRQFLYNYLNRSKVSRQDFINPLWFWSQNSTRCWGEKTKTRFYFVVDDTILISGDDNQDYDSYFYQLPVRCENQLDKNRRIITLMQYIKDERSHFHWKATVMIILVFCNKWNQCNEAKLQNCTLGGRTFGTLAGTGRPAGS